MKALVIITSMVTFLGAAVMIWQQQSNSFDEDSYLWLEEVMGERALKWVRERNTETLEELIRHPEFETLKNESLEILNAKDKLAYGSIRGEYVYNLWQDADHIKGLWRRQAWNDYLNAKDNWDVLLDLDELSRREKKSWVLKRAHCLKPNYERCLLSLSDGGKDASHIREFDLKTKSFVKDGFSLGESKSSVSWIDKDTVVLNSSLGQNELTDSGYSRLAKLWKRGTSPMAAPTLFEGVKTDVSAGGFVQEVDGVDELMFYRSKTFYTSAYFVKQGDRNISLPIPEDAEFTGIIGSDLLISLRSDQLGFKKGDLVSLDYHKLKEGEVLASLVFSPSSSQSLADVKVSKKYLFVTVLDDVYSKVLRFSSVRQGEQRKWEGKALSLPGQGTLSIFSVDKDTPKILANYEDFLTAPSLLALDPESLDFKTIQTLPSRFNEGALVAKQYKVTSVDGVEIPYFVVHKKGVALDGSNPTLLYGYGGFEVSLRPQYSSLTGKLWLERGGVYVVANIRGGGEYGPAWHQAALKHNRHKAYEDFIAVAEDLVAKKISSPKHLGISGGSNGGLLVGAVFTRRPDLFNAVVCMVPLLDMLRFHKLLAGASWMGEYGDPEDKADAKYLRSYSPFHVVRKGVSYPEVFFITSTKDDRVHPGHARKMVKRMDDLEHKVYYYENIEGGHSAAANLIQTAEQYAMQYSYLLQKLR